MSNVLKVSLQTTIYSLHDRGWSQRRIAKELGINCPATIISPHLATVIFPQCLAGEFALWFVVLLLVWFGSVAAAGLRPPGGGGRRPTAATRG